MDIFKQNDDREIAAQIQAATKITMDEETRERVRSHLLEYTKLRPMRVDSQSTQEQTPRNSFSWLMISYIRPMPIMAAVLIIAVSGSTVVAAEIALPGDVLYPIKVHVTEEIRASFAATPKARADWAMDRAERRLEEAATLALAGRLNDVARAEIDSNLDEHVRSAGKGRQQLESEDDVSGATEVETNIGAILFARENILGERRPERGAKVVALVEISTDAMTTMSASAEPQNADKDELGKARGESEAVAKGNRTAAKVRIEATKKFLSRDRNRLRADTRERAEARLKAAAEAFSSGDADAARGEKEEAFSNFNSALETATEIEMLISVSKDSNNDPNGRGSQDKKGDGQKDEKSGGGEKYDSSGSDD